MQSVSIIIAAMRRMQRLVGYIAVAWNPRCVRALYLAIISTALLLPGISFSQTSVPYLKWENSYGGSLYDESTSVQQTTDGGYIVAGYSGSSNGDVTGHHGTTDFDYWIVKLDTAGAIKWETPLGGTQNDFAECIQQTTDGGFIVAGYSYSTDGNVTGHHGTDTSSDYWVVKLDSIGTIKWEKSLGGTGNDQAYAIQQTADGGYIVAGSSQSTDGDVTGHQGGDTLSWDYWIVKLDSIGNIQWNNCYGGSGDDYANSIQQTSDGGYVVAGWSNSDDDEVTNNHGNFDYWILKINDTGAIQWEHALGGSLEDYAYSIQQTTDGGYIVAGWTGSSDGDVTGFFGTVDYWIVKLDNAGSIIWENCYGASGYNQATFIRQTVDGGYIVAGSSIATDCGIPGNNGNFHYWILKLDQTGNMLWNSCYGGNGGDEAQCIRQTGDNGYIVAGYSNSTAGDPTGNHGDDDYWIMKLNLREPIISSPQVQHLPTILCQPSEYDTLWIHNLGDTMLYMTSAAFLSYAQSFTVVSPVFPDSLTPGDSIRLIVLFYPDTKSFYGETLGPLFSITSNDSDLQNSQWNIEFLGRKDTIGSTVSNIRNDTLDFGVAYAGMVKDSFFLLTSNSTTITTFSFQSGSSLFTVAQEDTQEIGQPASIHVSFTGETPGLHVSTIIITDTCGRMDTVFVKAFVESIESPVISSIQSVVTPAIVCGTKSFDTIWVHNAGDSTLVISDDTIPENTPYYSVLSPAKLPVAVLPGDSIPLIVEFNASAFGVNFIGTLKDSILLFNNDTIPAHNPWKIFVANSRDSIGVAIIGINADTLDFGALSCNASKDSAFILHNTSTLAEKFSLPISGSSFSTVPIINVDSGEVDTVTVHFHGGNPEIILDSLRITDTCGVASVLYLKATIDSVAITLSKVNDTTICPGTAVTQTITALNRSSAAQVLILSYADTLLWAISQDTIALAAGSQNTLTITFQGSPDTVTYTNTFTFIDGCGGEHDVTSRVSVKSVNLLIPSSISRTICPFISDSTPLSITNEDSTSHNIQFIGTNIPPKPDSVTIAGGATYTAYMPFPAEDTGLYISTFGVLDECGTVYSGTISTRVASLPPLLLALEPDSNTLIIGDELKVYVVATPISAIVSGVSFSVVNEPTGLHVDSVTVVCGTNIIERADSVSINISSITSGCPPIQSDTIATLYYGTLLGYTATPYVYLSNTGTTNACDTVYSAGGRIITLSLASCDLGQAVLEPYVSGIHALYPNPNSGIATVEYSTVEQSNVSLSIRDELGRIIRTIINAPLRPGNYTTEFSIDDLQNGMYFVTMTEGKNYVEKEIYLMK